MQPGRPGRDINAHFDAAQNSPDFRNYWAAADSLDADSAHSREVRQRLVNRSRYEVANNGYADGMVQTHANYLVGKGPTLRMQTASKGFNQMVEAEWGRWCKAVKLRRKLWCMAHARVQDGEAFGLLRTNPRLRHQVKLDLQLIEAEQCQTPYLSPGATGKIDGITFDEFGNPISYDILPQHPGGQWSMTAKPVEVPALFVLHWFILRRPGQHRAVPEFRSTLNDGAQGRRWREATVSSAESVAQANIFIKTQLTPDTVNDPDVIPYDTVPFKKGMITALPNGFDPFQLDSKHPNSTFGEFNKSLISQQGRPKNMPFNVAACDSSAYNFASGKLDHQPYYLTLDCERMDGDDLVLDPLFEMWFAEAAEIFGWVTGPFPLPPHVWDWPALPKADIRTEAAARDTDLRNGTVSLSKVYSDDGRDFDDELPKLASDYGVSEDEMRQILRDNIFSTPPPPDPAQQAADAEEQAIAHGEIPKPTKNNDDSSNR